MTTQTVRYPPIDAPRMRALLEADSEDAELNDAARFRSAWQAQLIGRDWVAPAAYAWAIDRNEETLARHLENYLQGTVVAFLVASRRKPVHVRVRGAERVCPVDVDASWHDGGSLMNALWAALALRDLGARQLLETVPTSLVRASPTQMSDYSFAMLDAMRAMFRGEPDAPARTLHAPELTAPTHLDPRLPAAISDTLDVPVLEMMIRLMDRDTEGFTRALVKALELRIKWYTSSGRRHVPDTTTMVPAFLLPLDLIGLTGLARDRGMVVDVTSDFLPPCLIEGRIRTYVASTIRVAD